MSGTLPTSPRRASRLMSLWRTDRIHSKATRRARSTRKNSRHSGATARSTVRRLTVMFFSRASSWRTAFVLPALRRKRSRSQSDKPSSLSGRDREGCGRHSPCASQRRTVLREQRSLTAMRLNPHPRALSRSMADTSRRLFITSPPRSIEADGLTSSRSAAIARGTKTPIKR